MRENAMFALRIATRNKKLLGAPGHTTRSMDATRSKNDMTKLSKLLPQTSEPELTLHEPIELVADLKKRDIFCKFGLIELARCVICQTLFDILNPVRLAFVTLLRMDVLVQAFLPLLQTSPNSDWHKYV